MSQVFEASRSLTAIEQDSTIIAVIEMSQAKWLVAAIVPGVERQPLKRLDADETMLLKPYVDGAEKPARPGTRSNASSSLMRPDAMASGWRAGCEYAVSRPMSCIPRA